MGPGPNDFGLSRKHILAGVDASLRRLGTEYIDLYQVHCGTRLPRWKKRLARWITWCTAARCATSASSNFSAWQLQKAIDLSHQHGWEAFACLQPLYNLLDRAIEWDLRRFARTKGWASSPGARCAAAG